MIEFKNLNSFSHKLGGNHWIELFPNGYGVSIIDGNKLYTDEKTPYQVALIKHGKKINKPYNVTNSSENIPDYEVVFNDDFPDLISWQTSKGVNELINLVYNYE